MARRRIIRHTQEDLIRIALHSAHAFQKIAVESLIAHDWRVNSVYYSPRLGNRVIVMRHNKDSAIGTAVYPDGSFARSKTPTVKWDWKRCDDAATATIPDIYVRNILEKRRETQAA